MRLLGKPFKSNLSKFTKGIAEIDSSRIKGDVVYFVRNESSVKLLHKYRNEQSLIHTSRTISHGLKEKKVTYSFKLWDKIIMNHAFMHLIENNIFIQIFNKSYFISFNSMTTYSEEKRNLYGSCNSRLFNTR